MLIPSTSNIECLIWSENEGKWNNDKEWMCILCERCLVQTTNNLGWRIDTNHMLQQSLCEWVWVWKEERERGRESVSFDVW